MVWVWLSSKFVQGQLVSKEKKNKVVDESVAKLYDEYDEELDYEDP